jgi:hypothetical protein
MEYITITDFQGIKFEGFYVDKFEGFYVDTRRKLPKTAKINSCTYTKDFREVTTYSTNKKTYIFIKK